MGMSGLTTHSEMEVAEPDDRVKLEFGLEVRTICCYQFVPTACLLAACDHGEHEVLDPITGETGTRCDYPCVLYAPDAARTYHLRCEQRQSYSEAVDHALRNGSIRAEDEDEYMVDEEPTFEEEGPDNER